MRGIGRYRYEKHRGTGAIDSVDKIGSTDTLRLPWVRFCEGYCEKLETTVISDPIMSPVHAEQWLTHEATVADTGTDSVRVIYTTSGTDTFEHEYIVDTRHWRIVAYVKRRVPSMQKRYQACYEWTTVEGVDVVAGVYLDCEMDMRTGGYLFSDIAVNSSQGIGIPAMSRRRTAHSTTVTYAQSLQWIRVSAPDAINAVTLTDCAGRILFHKQLDRPRRYFRFSPAGAGGGIPRNKGIYLLRVDTDAGAGAHRVYGYGR